MEISQKYIDRFWGYVDKEKSNIFFNGTRCWEWTATCIPAGYGRMRIENQHEYAHRLAWMIVFSEMPPSGIEVCHSCDNPPCCNPDHLFLATHAENIKDRDRKGRGVSGGGKLFGEKSPKSKLTDNEVREIREIFTHGRVTLRSLSKKYGVSVSCIWSIVQNKHRKKYFTT